MVLEALPLESWRAGPSRAKAHHEGTSTAAQKAGHGTGSVAGASHCMSHGDHPLALCSSPSAEI